MENKKANNTLVAVNKVIGSKKTPGLALLFLMPLKNKLGNKKQPIHPWSNQFNVNRKKKNIVYLQLQEMLLE